MTPQEFIERISRDLEKIDPEDKKMMLSIVSSIKFYLKKDKELASSPLVINFIEEISSSLGITLTVETTQKKELSPKDTEESIKNAILLGGFLYQEDFGIDEIRTIEAFGQDYKNKRVSFSKLKEVEGYLVYSIISRYIKKEDRKLLDYDFYGVSKEPEEAKEEVEVSTRDKIKEFAFQSEKAGEMVFYINIGGEEFSIKEFIDEATIRKIYFFIKNTKNFVKDELLDLIEMK